MIKLFNIEKRILFFLFFISMIISVNFLIFIYPVHHELLKSTHEGIINNTIFAPIRHRLLFTWINEWFLRLYEMILGTKHSYFFTFFILMASSYFLSFVGGFKLFQLFHSKKNSIILCLLFGFSLIVGHFFHFAAPWSIIEPVLFCWGFIFAYQNKKTAFVIILLLAMLNRETGIFLSAAPLFAKHNLLDLIKKPKLIFSSLYEMACMIIGLLSFIAIRKITGETLPEMTWSAIAAQNFTVYKMILAAIMYALYFHIYLLPDFKYKELPPFLKNQMPVLIVSLVVFISFGIWVEIRMINGVLPLYLCFVGFSLEKFSIDK